jgi:hypothetical protein
VEVEKVGCLNIYGEMVVGENLRYCQKKSEGWEGMVTY